MAIAISAPYPNFFTPDGAPLEGGYVYIGVEGLNPIANPQQAYWDEALTIPAPAEVRVTGGYIVYNGAPARLYVAGNYSILVADKNGRTIFSRLYNTVYDADLFLTEPRGTLSRSMRTPGSFNINLILDGGYYSWTNAGTSNYPVGCGAADLFALEVLAAPDGAGIVYQRIVDISLAYATERYSWERKSIDDGATWSAWQSPLYGSDYVAISPVATPYSIVLSQFDTTILVTTGASAFVCNLPDASTVIGKAITIVKIDSGAGAIQITPNGSDIIATAGNVSIYLRSQYMNVKLLATSSGNWSLVSGNKLVFTPGNYVIDVYDIENLSGDAVYTEITRRIYCSRSGTVRIKFRIKRSGSSGTAYGQIYKNGVSVGTERGSTSTIYTEYSEDLSVTVGDYFSIFCYKGTALGVYIDRFVVSCGDEL